MVKETEDVFCTQLNYARKFWNCCCLLLVFCFGNGVGAVFQEIYGCAHTIRRIAKNSGVSRENQDLVRYALPNNRQIFPHNLCLREFLKSVLPHSYLKYSECSWCGCLLRALGIPALLHKSSAGMMID